MPLCTRNVVAEAQANAPPRNAVRHEGQPANLSEIKKQLTQFFARIVHSGVSGGPKRTKI